MLYSALMFLVVGLIAGALISAGCPQSRSRFPGSCS